MLNFIRNNGIDNVEFLTTDNHGTLQNQVFIDRFTDHADDRERDHHGSDRDEHLPERGDRRWPARWGCSCSTRC